MRVAFLAIRLGWFLKEGPLGLIKGHLRDCVLCCAVLCCAVLCCAVLELASGCSEGASSAESLGVRYAHVQSNAERCITPTLRYAMGFLSSVT